MNIILTGFMATGKTDIGMSIARLMKMKFIDTDELIEYREDMKISEIFSVKGEKYFRDLEYALAEELGGSDNCVVSTGGGFVLKPENIAKIRKHGWVVNLYASVDRIIQRVEGRTDRPLLNNGDRRKKIETLLEARKKFYENCDLAFDTTDTMSETAAKDIIGKLGLWQKKSR